MLTYDGFPWLFMNDFFFSSAVIAYRISNYFITKGFSGRGESRKRVFLVSSLVSSSRINVTQLRVALVVLARHRRKRQCIREHVDSSRTETSCTSTRHSRSLKSVVRGRASSRCDADDAACAETQRTPYAENRGLGRWRSRACEHPDGTQRAFFGLLELTLWHTKEPEYLLHCSSLLHSRLLFLFFFNCFPFARNSTRRNWPWDTEIHARMVYCRGWNCSCKVELSIVADCLYKLLKGSSFLMVGH